MSDSAPWTIFTDGAARGNPGPAAFAFVIERPGAATVEEAGCLGDTTNNIAEYTALIRALERARELGGRHLLVRSDSELMVKQLNGEYKVKHPGLAPLFRQARALADRFVTVTFQHIRREQNRRADQLGNDALDGKSTPGNAATVAMAEAGAAARPAAGATPSASVGRRRGKIDSPTYRDKAQAVREQALDCLRTAAAAWARGNAGDPPPDAVWEQLWDILRQENVLV